MKCLNNASAKARVTQAHEGMALAGGSKRFKNYNIPPTEYLFCKYK